jgi:polyhydroxybutyrate depolymerase
MIWIILLVPVALVIVVITTYFIVNRTNGQIESAGQLRKYLLYVPASYDPNTPTPLVISIHGFVQWPAHQQKLTGWNLLADEHGFIVVYPQGTGFPLRWKAQPIDDDPEAMTRELQFFSDLIDFLSLEYNIDQLRIYANGMSNGGGMSHLLACEFSDRIAAIGGVAGAYLYPWDCCQPRQPVPVIAFHGTDDPIVPYNGGLTNVPFHRYEFLPIEEWAVNWARKNGCANKPETVPAIGEVSGIRYTSCYGDAEVVLYTVEGGGHTWPGGSGIPKWLAGHTTRDVNAAEIMWEFFKGYSLTRKN